MNAHGSYLILFGGTSNSKWTAVLSCNKNERDRAGDEKIIPDVEAGNDQTVNDPEVLARSPLALLCVSEVKAGITGSTRVSHMSRLLVSLVLPAIGVCLAITAVISKLAGIGTLGFGSWEIALLVTDTVFIVATSHSRRDINGHSDDIKGSKSWTERDLVA